MAEVLFRAKLQRDDPKRKWGFCLQGGADCKKPLTLLQVQAESVAAKGGLMPGDIVVKLAGQSALGMTHGEAQKTIIDAGNSLEIIVERSEELTSPTYAPADMMFPEPGDSQLVSMPTVQTKTGMSGEQNGIGFKERTNGPLMKAPEVISNSSEDPFPVKPILKAKTTNNHKVKLAGKTVKFLDESPPRRMRRPSPSPVRRRRAPAYTGRKRSSSAPTYTRVRITGRDQSPSAQMEYERKVNIISGTGSPVSENLTPSASEYKVAVIPPFTRATDTIATNTTTTTTMAAAGADTPVSDSDGDPRYPWRRSRADTARRADIFKQEMAERRAQGQAVETKDVPRAEVVSRPRAGVVGGGTPIAVQHHTLSSSSGILVNQPNLVSQPQVITSTVPAHIPVIIRPHFTHQHFVLSPMGAQRPFGFGLGSPPERNTPSPVRVKSPSPTPQTPPVHTVTMAPEVADLPMPAVKEIVQDLNRRLELLAAKQPELTKPLTPTELGISYLKKDMTGSSSSSSNSTGSSGFASKTEAKNPLNASPHKPQPAQSPPLQKIYDVSSPLSSPTARRKQFNMFQSGASSPFSPQKKVTFADQLEDFRIIEPRTKETGATLFTTVASPELGTTFDHIKPGVTYQYNVPKKQFGISVNEPESPATGPLSPPSQPRPSVPSTSQASVNISQPKLSVSPAAPVKPSSPLSPPRPAVSVAPSIRVPPPQQRPGLIASSAPSPVRFTMPLAQQSRQAYHFSISKSGIEVTPKPYLMQPANIQVGSIEPLSLQYSVPPNYADAMYASSQGVKAAENFPGYYSLIESGTPTRQGLLTPEGATYHKTPAMVAEQARLIRFLDQKMAEGGNAPAPPPTPTQAQQMLIMVPQGIAASKPFPQTARSPVVVPQQYVPDPTPTAVVPTGAVPSSPIAMAAAAARALGSAMGDKHPGLIAILDKNFTEKLLQWQQEREGGMEQSETYRLVHEMDTQKRRDVTDL